MNEATVIQAALRGDMMHALLLSGPDKARCADLALHVAAAYLFRRDDPSRLDRCPDYIRLTPPHSVESIREMIGILSNRSFSESGDESSSSPLWDTAGRRCVCITDAHTMNAGGQNALLKILEEPPEQVLFILVGTESAMLQTIRSRSSVVRLGVPSKAETSAKLQQSGIETSVAEVASTWADGLESDARLFCRESYVLFRKTAAHIFMDALNGKPVYTASAALLKTEIREEAEIESDKKVKTEAYNAPLCVQIWQSLTRDAILQKLSTSATVKSELLCPESDADTADIARHFTFSQLECIIEMLDSGIARLSGGANPSQTVDLLLTGLPRKEK